VCYRRDILMDYQKNITSADHLSFVREKVLSVSDLTRTKKLTEILNLYAADISEEVYVIQNSKNKKASAVISDLEYFQELLLVKEAVEDAVDQLIYDVAIDRKDDPADINLNQIIRGGNLDQDRILDILKAIEE
jgi:hypothetical protein